VLPFHLRLGPFALSPVELTAVLGVALVAILSRRMMSPQPTAGGMIDLMLAALLGGAIGARLFYFVPLWIRGLEPGSKLFTDWSQGSGYLGGLVGGTIAVYTVARLKKLDPLNVVDTVGLHIPLGFALGKFGCFLAGCCYGPRCDGFPGVAFARGSLAYEEQRIGAIPMTIPPARALPVHPTQLYELGLGILLFLGLRVVHRRSRRPGETYLAYVAGYSVWRFIIEFFRSDPGRHTFGASALSDSQITSIVLGVAAAAAWAALRRRKPVAAPEPSAPKN
jgi:phosphatidylglycerol---prolipoprotein diacylglyceryl transferase